MSRKGLTAGYLPMAATITTEKVWENFLGSHKDGRAFYHGHTFGGNPLAAAVALESLNIFQEERLLETLRERIEQLQYLVKKSHSYLMLEIPGNVGSLQGLILWPINRPGTLTPGKMRWGREPAWPHGNMEHSYDSSAIRLSSCHRYQSALPNSSSFSMQ